MKDWPPTQDFKSAFPDLYNDFAVGTPVPNYVRRDGVLNLASHFPSNTISPDMGMFGNYLQRRLSLLCHL